MVTKDLYNSVNETKQKQEGLPLERTTLINNIISKGKPFLSILFGINRRQVFLPYKKGISLFIFMTTLDICHFTLLDSG